MDSSEKLGAQGDPDFMTSLARGLAVIEAFNKRRRPLTVAQASEDTGLGRSAVRRCLHTLERLGYITHDGQKFSLRPRTLSLGFAYLRSDPLASGAGPLLERVRDRLRESCSLGVRDGDEVRYVGRAATTGIMSIGLHIGSRLPLYCTSMGRVLLASMPDNELEAYLTRTNFVGHTARTQTDPLQIAAVIEEVRHQGYAIVDQELEIGLRSIAVPVSGRDGRTIAAINVGTPAARTSVAELHARVLPELQRGASELTDLIWFDGPEN
jgi:IclR family pca regulon transcriptional regulator